MEYAFVAATLLGLPFPLAYMNLSETERSKISTGLNYGSSCGILPETGSSEVRNFQFCISVEKLKRRKN